MILFLTLISIWHAGYKGTQIYTDELQVVVNKNMNRKHGYKKNNTTNCQTLGNPQEVCGVHFLDTVIIFSAAVRNGRKKNTIYCNIFKHG